MNYDTALRGYTSKRIEEIDSADILIGIPCFNNEKTIAHVIQMVTHGLAKYYKNQRSVIFIADGGSTDDTREAARDFEIKPWQEKIVSIYRGPGGKGTALRSLFEAADRLDVRVCAMVDSDLRSITADWVQYLLDPVLERGYQFVAPVYMRHKYDGTITNNIVYNLTRALYGKQIRQPIGGDFALSRDVAKFYTEQDVWTTDVARFGIDIIKDPILVYPTLHYQNGGVALGPNGETNVPNLYGAGEISGGVHGRNRLMGNSLLEICVFGRRAGRAAAERAKEVTLGKLSLAHVDAWNKEVAELGIVETRKSPILLPDYVRHQR